MKNDITKDILKKFIYNDKLKYNEIWDKSLCSSSHFDYHLKKLINRNIITKNEEYYELTPTGEAEIFKIDGLTIENKEKPLVCAFVLAVDGDKLLLNERLKQPFYGYYNIPGGKVELGETTVECAKREFFEETGLACEPSLSQIVEKITYDDETNQITHHMIGYFYKTDKFEGTLDTKNREGKNHWITIEEFKKQKRFPEGDELFPRVANAKKLDVFTIKRYKRDGIITRYEIIE